VLSNVQKTLRFCAALVAVLTLAACSGGDAGGDRPARPDELRLIKVSGDGQRASVLGPAGTAASTSALRLGVSAQTDSDLLPEPLVAKILVSATASAARASLTAVPTGPSASVSIPPGTLVQWRTRDPRCGSPYITVTAAGDSGTVENRWRRGTIAGVECRMVLELIYNSEPLTADSFSATFDPGPAAQWTRTAGVPGSPMILPAGFVTDVHGNPVPFRVAVEGGPATVDGTTEGTEAARTIRWPANTTGKSVLYSPGISLYSGDVKLTTGVYQIDGASWMDIAFP
jgi:hypothetical protein